MNTFNLRKVHTSYKDFLTKNIDTPLSGVELNWRRELLDSPNGFLLTKNSFFDNLLICPVIYLQHTTTNLKKILEEGKIYSSGGCLGGSIYCTPLIKEGDSFRMHNLGQYIYETEAQMMTKDSISIDSLIFEIKLAKDSNKELLGINHLLMGEFYFSNYEKLKPLLDQDLREKIEQKVLERVKKSISFLCQCNINSTYSSTFLNSLIETIKDLLFLEYVYFVAISEYLMLYQDNNLSKEYSAKGEFYNPTYKDLMYAFLNPNDSSSIFNPSIDELIKYIEIKKIFTKFDQEHFKKYLHRRSLYLCNSSLFNLINTPFNMGDINIKFGTLVGKAKPLVGHLLNHLLKKEFREVFYRFEQSKAESIWNFWNEQSIQIPFNGVIPKGEVGINPSHSRSSIKVYLGKIMEKNSNFSYLLPLEELDIKITPELVNTTFSVMRDSVKEPKNPNNRWNL